jgi:hypothetical protein
MSLFNIIAFLTDNGQGICHLSVAKLCKLLQRHRDTILENLGALEKDGLIIIYRKAGMMNRYTIAYPRGLAEIGPNVGMVLDAFLESPKPRVWTSAEDAIASATNQSGTSDRSGLPYGSGARHRSGLAGEPVGSNPHSIKIPLRGQSSCPSSRRAPRGAHRQRRPTSIGLRQHHRQTAMRRQRWLPRSA